MTDVENENLIESGEGTSDELLELKKNLADEVVDKLLQKDSSLMPFLLKWSISNYLVDDWSFKDLIHDEVLFKGFWDSVWLITPALKKYREMFGKVNTKGELENLRKTIFDDIWSIEQTTLSANEQWNTTSSDNKVNKPNDSEWWRDSVWKIDNSKSTVSSTQKAKVGWGRSYEIDHFTIEVTNDAKKIWNSLKWKEKPDLEPFACAYKAYKIEKANWNLWNDKYLTIADFTKNMQTDNRFFVINMSTNTVVYSEKCGHGEGSWWSERATSFSNKSWSHKSSLWAYITPNKSRSNNKWTWVWSFPKWQEKSNNASRWIAIHPVGSLSYSSWKSTSEWCFTIPASQSHVDEILNKINWWSLVFAYAKSKDYFAQSDYFQQRSDGSVAA